MQLKRPATWGAIAFAILFLTILIVAYTGNLPPQLARLPHHDKLGHVILYAIATFLGHLALRRRHIILAGKPFPLWVLFFGSFTIVEELVQGLSPNRSLDAMDLVCSLVGVGLGYGLAERTAKRSKSLPDDA
ncbi:hypothetical protein [Vacuolonema iberomarrocanum]|uniref:hypothetical protein n=1 Tax=Vacuolonema iberomarrocanum TaxID=3454632 RepID=UPI0019EAC6A1|nr:hypothetical protein [filamentous cyanobacterium LEGE 07170]